MPIYGQLSLCSKTYKLLKSVLLINLLVISSSYYAGSSKSFTLGITIFPPLTMQDETTNECNGVAIDVSRKIIQHSGHGLKVICAPAARIYKMMEQGTVDFTVNVKSTRQLEPHATFMEPRLTAIKLQLYTHDKDMPSLVAGIRSFDYHGYRQQLEKQNYQFVDVANADDAITMFIKERTKALITYERPFKSYLKRHLNNHVPTGITVEEFLSIGIYYGVSRHSTNHDELISVISQYTEDTGIAEFIPAENE